MKTYRNIFFDLDHTLWDFRTNARHTIEEMFELFDMSSMGFTETDSVFIAYEEINESLWKKYRAHEIDKSTLRIDRFRQLLDIVGNKDNNTAIQMNDFYVTTCREKTSLIPGTIDVLNELSQKYDLHIISNGFKEAQYVKIRNCGLEPYFNQIILSDEVGFQKPRPEIFEEAVKRAQASKPTSIYIGDHLETDVIGAINYGMDVIYFNSAGVPHNTPTTFEIRHLKELTEIL